MQGKLYNPIMDVKKKYAKRLKEIPPYLFAEIDREMAKKRAQGVDIINLGIGDPDIPTPGNIVQKLCESAKDPKNHRYPSYDGMPRFKEAVVKWYERRFNVCLNEKETIALIGSKEGIAHIPLAFVNKGDDVLCPNPGYTVYHTATIFAGGSPVAMPLRQENGFKPVLSAIKKPKKAKLMFLNYPNNPTAATAGKEFFKEVVDFAQDNDIIVCHDNAYSEVTFGGYKASSFLETRNAKEVGIEFHSLSKTYNMTGWRIGFAAGNEDVIAGLGKVKENIDSGIFQALQWAGIEALEGPQDSVAQHNRIIEDRMDYFVEELSALGWDVKKPSATFYLWFPCKGSSMEFSRRLLDETGVVMTPGVGFGKHGEGYVRAALTQSRERLAQAVERIKKAGI